MSNIDDVLGFAEWIDVEGIRAERHQWTYRGDNYEKKHTTEEMYNIWKEIKI